MNRNARPTARLRSAGRAKGNWLGRRRPKLAHHGTQRSDCRIILSGERVNQPKRRVRRMSGPDDQLAGPFCLLSEVLADQTQADACTDETSPRVFMVGF